MATLGKCTWTAGGVTKDAWKVRYTDATGAARTKQFAGKREASAFLRTATAGEAATAAPKTIADLCADYLLLAQRRRGEGRIGHTRLSAITAAFRNKVQVSLGSKLAEAVTAADIEDYHDELLRGGSLNARSARVQLEYLRLVEDEANKRGHMLARPVEAMMRDLRAIPRDTIRTFTVQEVRQVVDHAARRARGAQALPAARLECFVNVAAFCGLRRGEIAALTVDAVQFSGRVIEVRHSLTDERELKRPKTRSGIRDVPLPLIVANLLREWIERHYRPNPRRLLFTGRDGRAFDIDLIHPVWTGLLDRAGLAHGEQPFHFHALRHFYASMMIEAGTPLPDAAILLGHRCFDETLQTYTHSLAFGSSRHVFADRMAERFAAGLPPIAPALPGGGAPSRTAAGSAMTIQGDR